MNPSLGLTEGRETLTSCKESLREICILCIRYATITVVDLEIPALLNVNKNIKIIKVNRLL
jgi:hypothetical protein